MTIGTSVPRREDARLLSGRGRYVADHVELRPLHAAFVRSDHAHAWIVGIDAAAARDAPGVVAVLTAAELPRVTLSNARHVGLYLTEQPVLAAERVRFVGEAVAVVLAVDRYAAEDGAELVLVDYEPLAPSVRADLEPEPDALLFADLPGNLAFDEKRTFGEPDQAFDEAAHVVTRSLDVGRQSAAPMETRGCIASFDALDNTLNVWASTQSPHSMRRKLARVTGLGEHRIVVHVDDVGGAFGQKIPLHPEEAVVALAAVHLGATVQWIEDRRENLLAAPHARQQHLTLALALDAGGAFIGLRADVLGDAGAYSFNAGTALSEPYLTARSMLGPYRIANYGYRVRVRLTNKSPVAPYRGVGFVNSQLIRELLIDDAARVLGGDRIELRRRNLVRAADFPYRNAVGMVYDSGSYTACLDAVADSLHHAVATHAAARNHAGSRLRLGVGISPFVEPTAPGSKLVEQVWDTPSGEADEVRVELDTTGTATVSFGTPSIGQGIETVVTQIVAEELHLPLDAVVASVRDTSSAPYSLTGTRGSRSAVISGGAAALAAQEVRRSVARVAAMMFEAAVDDIVVGDGKVWVSGSDVLAIPVADVVVRGMTSPGVRAALPGVTFTSVKSFDPEGACYSNGCVGIVVEVDPTTGAARPVHVVVAHDCGTVVNPAIVEGQIAGAVLQGIGSAILERLEYGVDGQPLASTFMDYLVPTSAEAPRIEMVHFASPSPHTWRGVKGAGEAGTIGATAAMVAAVADAAGAGAALIRALPLQPPRVAALFVDEEESEHPQAH